jgi:hypothetical protein
MVDLPRRVRRLAAPLPLDPAATDTHRPAGPSLVAWTLEPTLLNAGSHRLRTRVARVIALYAEAEGQPRAVVEALSPRIEEEMGNYRLGRCIARTVEHCAYKFAPPPVALPHEPAALRALCYRRAQEQYGGYVPRAKRAAFLAAVAAELDTTPAQLEDALWADRIGAALLLRRTERVDSAAGPVAEAVHPPRVIAQYNAAAVATVVAASSWVTLHLAASETAALKALYRHAKALHVGLDITQGATEDVLDLTLYGPGSRALVRSRASIAGGGGPDETRGRTGDTTVTAAPAEDNRHPHSCRGRRAGRRRSDAPCRAPSLSRAWWPDAPRWSRWPPVLRLARGEVARCAARRGGRDRGRRERGRPVRQRHRRGVCPCLPPP